MSASRHLLLSQVRTKPFTDFYIFRIRPTLALCHNMSGRITNNFKEVKKRHNNSISSLPSTSSRKDPVPSTSTHERHNKDPDLAVLKQFDLRLEFGPCIGITRKERWERAEKHGLSPPQEVMDILLRHPDNDTYLQSLWKDYNI